MTRAKYTPDRKGIADLLDSPELNAAMRPVAEAALAYAKSIAPVDSGRYKESLKLKSASIPVGRDPSPRVGYVIYSDAPHGGVVEHTHKVLSRTADAMGGA